MLVFLFLLTPICQIEKVNASRVMSKLNAMFFTPVKQADLLKLPRAVDMLLVKHVQGSVEACKQQRLFLLAVDKHSGNGLALSNGIMTVPGNTGFTCVPQVAITEQMSLAP